ncbi:MAG: hypothetical protein JWP22_1455 [Ramlibacter sp.]|nr:hypothetical protein [Ramlibacter sp.]
MTSDNSRFGNLKTLHDDSPFGVFRTDSTGAASYANPACREITGLTPKDFLGFGWIDAIHSEDRRRVVKDWREACAAQRALDISYCTVRPDGARRYVRVRSRPLGGSRTRPASYVAVAMDVTEQVLAERRLRKNNELLSAVLENIPCGVTVYDADGSLVLDTQQLRSLLRAPDGGEDSVITDFGTIALDRRGAGARSHPDTAAMTTRDSDLDPAPRVREEVQPDGRVLEVRDAPMPTGGVVTAYTDITQHKSSIESLQQAKAAAEQATAVKAAFLATMSHEIRTPMNGVIGMTNILLDSPLTPDQRESVEVIRQSGESLLVVLNDILDYSKIESGQMELEWVPLCLGDVVDNTLRLLAPKALEKQVLLSVDMDPAIPPVILGDRTRLQQVLVNLVSNAVKFTEKGQVRISIRSASADSGAPAGSGTGDLSKIAVCIKDTGVGIAQDKLGSIFDPFVQADSSTARRYGGTGLGLAIARRLVEAMGGGIGIASELGVGTEACFDFLAETAVPRSRAANSLHAPLWGKRVLLLRGSRSDVRVLVAQLKRWGMVVESARSTVEALATLRGAESIDLLVAATHHPVDSRELEFVRDLRDEGIAVPAVLLARTKGGELADPALRAWIIGRTSTESDLYDALVSAVHCSREGLAEDQLQPLFDDTLGQTLPLRILVAEDNEINRKVVLRMLAGFGYQADVACNGAQAIEAVQRQDYDLVLMDMQMPQVDGIEATRFIVQNIPIDRRPRIVAMSANVMREDVDAALAAGAAQHVGKPFTPSQLREALQLSSRGDSRATKVATEQQEQPSGVLCAERVRCHLQGDRTGGFLSELTASFATAARELLDRLAKAVRAADGSEMRACIHEYSGMCAVVGAVRLTRLLSQLQELSKGGSAKDAAASMVEQCRCVQDETIAALLAAVRQHAAQAPPPALTDATAERQPIGRNHKAR